MRAGYAAEDGAALHFRGTELSRVVASRPAARGYRLDAVGERVVEMRLATAYLGDPRGRRSPPLVPEAISTARRRLMAPRRILALGRPRLHLAGPPDRGDLRAACCGCCERAERPRICLLPTASGDTAEQIARFYAAFGERACEPSDLSLFRLGRQADGAARPPPRAGPDLRRRRQPGQPARGLGGARHRAPSSASPGEQGIVLAGQSAGAMCWFEAGITKSSGKPPRRRPASGCSTAASASTTTTSPSAAPPTSTAVGDGMPGGYGLDDYAGLLWEEGTIAMALSARPGAAAYRVGMAEGSVVESRLEAWPLDPLEHSGPPPEIAEFRRELGMRRRAARAC